MIKIRLASLGNISEKDLEIKEGEDLKQATDRALDALRIPEVGKTHFNFLVNGHLIPAELARDVKLGPNDLVLIAPKITEGESGELLKQVAVIVVTVVASAYTGGAAAGIGGALLTAGAAIGTRLLLDNLFPPPIPEPLNLSQDFGSSGFSSQAYTISGQSNQVRAFGIVPKVYGRHRLFPNVAATPYTELETDPGSGTLVQFFYAIYDFGYGPNIVTDLKIGDTPLTAFSDLSYKFVDLNRPITSEGVWDDPLERNFSLYKGQVEQDAISTALNKNQTDSPSPDLEDYQATRNAATNTENAAQEITVTLVCPRGLYCFSSTGARDFREIIGTIQFAQVGTEDWRNFNDFSYVSDFKYVGGDVSRETTSILIAPFNQGEYVLEQTFGPITSIFDPISVPIKWTKEKYYYIPAGATSVILADGAANGGDLLITFGVWLGVITDIEPYIAGYKRYYLDRPIANKVLVYQSKQEVQTTGYATETPLGPELFLYSGTNEYAPFTPGPIQGGRLFKQSVSPGRFSIRRNETSPVYCTVKFTPRTIASYKVRVTRNQSISTFTSTIADEMTWSVLSTRFEVPPVVTTKRHTFLEIKIRATNQLSGSIQNLSGVVESVLDVYNGSTWVKQVSRNPAWIFTDLLTSPINKRAIDKSRLHLPSLTAWADFCDEVPGSPGVPPYYSQVRFQSNFIFDFASTLQAIIGKVTGSGQAALNIIDGKYGVLIDRLQTTPVQIFTPRNSWGFSSTRNYSRKPNAVKVSYIDPGANWDVTETTVYDNGFNFSNAEDIDEISSFAVTNEEQAFRYGRYLLASNRLRQETISISVDFEHLVCTRGDYIQITQDVMKVGGSPARVKSVSGNQITIDDGIETIIASYGFVFRGSDGVIVTDTLTVVSSDTFDLDGSTFPEVGDLIVIGIVDEIVFDCIVKSITPNSDLTANLTLVEKADGIYTSETDLVLEDYSPKISTTQDTEFVAPGPVVDLVIADNSYRCIQGSRGIEYYITLDWDVPTGAAFDVYEVYLDYGKGYDIVSTQKDSLYTYIVPTTNLGLAHNFKVIAVSATGKKLDLGTVPTATGTPLEKTAPPSDVETLNIDITGETLQLFWPAIPDCDLSEYLIRYSPVTTDTWETSVPLLRIGGNSTLAATQARTGIYLIKAIDLTGNESENHAAAITTIPELFGLNIIDEVTDFPTLNGTFDRVVDDGGGALLLQETISGGVGVTEYEPEGYYYYENFLDLGEIYSVRLQSKIRAEGFSLQDLMANWATLSSVTALTTSGFSDWDVEAQYRTTESFNVMADWVTLDSIDPLSEGQQDLWTAWKKFIIGDATGRIFQFRLRLISNNVSVTPRVFDGTIRSDMPDRVESYNNIAVPGGGEEIVYDPSFKGPGTTPNIQVSISDAQSGDYWTFDYKTLDSFYIRFFDVNDNPTSRTADFAVKGYGRKALEII
jgi:hypothetical protein